MESLVLAIAVAPAQMGVKLSKLTRYLELVSSMPRAITFTLQPQPPTLRNTGIPIQRSQLGCSIEVTSPASMCKTIQRQRVGSQTRTWLSDCIPHQLCVAPESVAVMSALNRTMNHRKIKKPTMSSKVCSSHTQNHGGTLHKYVYMYNLHMLPGQVFFRNIYALCICQYSGTSPSAHGKLRPFCFPCLGWTLGREWTSPRAFL